MANALNSDNKISVTMISNAMSHHQLSFCNSMNEIDDVNFHFIATKPIAKERLDIGYRDLNNERDYIVRSYESEASNIIAAELANESDFVIYGSAPFEFIKKRIKKGKWTFIYSERLFKEVRGGDLFNIKTIIACFLRYSLNSHKHLRLLCSSAFASKDYSFFRFKNNQTYKWGYFPPISNNDYEMILKNKEPKSIIWVGRFIHWKHPELAVELAEKLRNENIPFHLNIVGDGTLGDELKKQVNNSGLTDCVSFLGVLNTIETRAAMESSKILITTSDHNEGWGAVVNEGMSSGCAVVASHLMGSVPYLIRDGVNGRIFESENADDLFFKVSELLEDDNLREKYGRNAFETIADKWNGAVAASRLSELFRRYKKGDIGFAYKDGICSNAERLSNNWIEK